MSTKEAYEQVYDLCEAEGWLQEAEPERQLVRFKTFKMKNGSFTGIGVVGQNQFDVVMCLGFSVPEGLCIS